MALNGFILSLVTCMLTKEQTGCEKKLFIYWANLENIKANLIICGCALMSKSLDH